MQLNDRHYLQQHTTRRTQRRTFTLSLSAGNEQQDTHTCKLPAVRLGCTSHPLRTYKFTASAGVHGNITGGTIDAHIIWKGKAKSWFGAVKSVRSTPRSVDIQRARRCVVPPDVMRKPAAFFTIPYVALTRGRACRLSHAYAGRFHWLIPS